MKISTGNSTKPLLASFQEQYVDWMHACGGKGRCTTCKFQIIRGYENFEQPTPPEERYFASGELVRGERLACQAVIFGDVTIQVPDESKLPHIKYSE